MELSLFYQQERLKDPFNQFVHIQLLNNKKTCIYQLHHDLETYNTPSKTLVYKIPTQIKPHKLINFQVKSLDSTHLTFTLQRIKKEFNVSHKFDTINYNIHYPCVLIIDDTNKVIPCKDIYTGSNDVRIEYIYQVEVVSLEYLDPRLIEVTIKVDLST